MWLSKKPKKQKESSHAINFFLIICFLLFFVLSGTTYGFSSSWQVYEKNNLQVFFPEGYDYQAREVLCFLNEYYQEVMKLTGNEKKPEVKVVLEDYGLRSRGFADSTTYTINIYIDRPTTTGRYSSGYKNWYRYLGVHELTHIGHLTNDSELFFSSPVLLFSNFLTPNVSSPHWMVEGIATYAEARLTDYEGRLNDGYYNALMAAKVQSDEFPVYEEIGYQYREQYPYWPWYLYGSKFFDYLAEEYGEEKFAAFFKEYSSYYWAIHTGNLFPGVGIDRAARNIFGKKFSDLFVEWKSFEENKYSDWGIEGEEIVPCEGGEIYSLEVENNKIYYLQERKLDYSTDAEWSTLLIEYDPQMDVEKVINNTGSGMHNSSLQIIDNKLYYSRITSQKGYPNTQNTGRINSLFVHDLDTHRERRIMKDEFKDYVVLESGKIIYVKNSKNEYGSEIWKYRDQERKKIGQVDQLIGEVIISDDDLVVVSKRRNGTWNMNNLNLDRMELEPIVESEAAVKWVKSIDNYIYFTSNYEKKFSSYRYDLNNEKIERLTFDGYAGEGVEINDTLYFVTVGACGEKMYKKSVTGVEYDLPVEEYVELNIEDNLTGIEAQNAGLKNLSFLASPRLTSIPYILPFKGNRLVLEGRDAIGLTEYELATSDFNELDLEFSSGLLPVNFNIDGGYNYDNGIQVSHLGLEYPAFYSLDYGLNEFVISSDTFFDNKGEIKESELQLNTDFSYKKPGISDISFIYERNINSEEQKGLDLNLALQEQGLSNIGITYYNDEEDESEIDLSLDYLLNRHKFAFFSNDHFNNNFYNYRTNYEYLRNSSRLFLSGEVREERLIDNEETEQFIRRKTGQINISHIFGRNKKLSINNRLIEQEYEGFDNLREWNSYSTSIGVDYIINRRHRLDLSGSLRYVEGKRKEYINEYITYNIDVDSQHKLLEVRRGLQNPGVFLADIYGNMHCSYGDYINNSGEGEFSYGYEIKAEGGFASHFKIVPRAGFEISGEEREYYFEFDISAILGNIF